MRTAAALLTAGAVALGSPVWAQQSPTNSNQPLVRTIKGPVVTGETSVITGKIDKVDQQRRTVSVTEDNGRSMSLYVGKDVRNFDNVKVGDRVTVQYSQATAVALAEAPGSSNNDLGAIRSKVESSASSQAQGSRPGMATTERTTVVANVFDIDREKGVVTLRGTNGVPVEVRVNDPQAMRQIDLNDQVVISYIEAAAVSIEPAGKAGNASGMSR